ncbi:hypothetical protein [Botrimarina hoheduenensis]|uniref:Uncharacterized protein n=1 Tax=Botrimarina hoheduenensis TaxID=2528000 RepID=A0A5C5VW24_9BACT|nr:hypothetical protein [Botrimarina hoheduenensis]TWT42560.1 hypothetical protein Pla111_28650 [Botrimarina hoheduenensis]
MRRQDDNVEEMPGGDSFLDVIANIVGILVLLVVVVGVRAARDVAPAPPAAEPIDIVAIEGQARAAEQAAIKAARDTTRLIEQAALADIESERREQIRATIALYNAELKAELDEERGQLDENTQRTLATRNQLVAARQKLDDATRRQVSLINAAVAVPTEVIGVNPTPIVSSRVEEQVRLILRNGRVTIIPMDDFKSAIGQLLASINKSLEAAPGEPVYYERVVGPFEGFSMRLLARQRVVSTSQGTGYGSEFVQGRIEENAQTLYEPVEIAMEDGSRLLTLLSGIRPDRTVVTVHAFPDSFEETPNLKAALEQRGYRVAVTPQTQGRPIGFSSGGRETVLQ